MIIEFLSVLAFTIIVIVAMVASGQQGKDDEWLSDHSRISMIDESSLGTAFHSSTISTGNEETTHLLDTQESSSLPGRTGTTSTMNTMPSATSQQPTFTVETDHATVRMPTHSSLGIALTTPMTLEITTSTESAAATTSMESILSALTAIDTIAIAPQPNPQASTDPTPPSAAQVSASPTPSPRQDAFLISAFSAATASPILDSSPDNTPDLHSEVATSPVNLSAGWGGSLVMSTWTTPAKTAESTLNVVSSSSQMSAPAAPTTTAVPTLENTPQNDRPDRRPGEVVNSILQVIGGGHWQLGGH
ncbi:hypothetical protein LTR95_016044 [Oleoguttula sp. CCFEE 5521]